MKNTTAGVDMRSEDSVREFLARHPRYDTMSSWNRTTSFSQCIKIHALDLESDPRIRALDAKYGQGTASNTAYGLLDVAGMWSEVGLLEIARFTAEMNDRYTIGSNGRSGGYLVLYNSHKEESQYKSFCRSCGKRNYQKVADLTLSPEANKCGVCGAVGEHGRHNYQSPLMTLQIWPGRPIGEDLDEMSFAELKSLAKVVLAFDQTCRRIRDNFIGLVLTHTVEDKVVMVPKTIKTLAKRKCEVSHA